MKPIKASTGLTLKPTYDKLFYYIQEDPDKVKYPNRTATMLRRSFELSQLDGIGNLELEKMQVEKLVEEDKEGDDSQENKASPPFHQEYEN